MVFNKGEDALRILPPLIDVLPEARFNLVVYYIQQNEIESAFKLMKEFRPSTVEEYILKATTYACMGQENKVVSSEKKISFCFFKKFQYINRGLK